MFKYYLRMQEYFINDENKLDWNNLEVEFDVSFGELIILLFSPFIVHLTLIAALFTIPLYFMMFWGYALAISIFIVIISLLGGSIIDDEDLPTKILYQPQHENYVEIVDNNAVVLDKFAKIIIKEFDKDEE